MLALAALSGIVNALDKASLRNAGDKMDTLTIWVFSFIGGPIGGILTLFLGGFLVRWTGKFLGGQGTSEHLRAAFSWTSVPLIASFPLLLAEAVFLGDEMFKSSTPIFDKLTDDNLVLLFTLLAVYVTGFVLSIWSVCLMIITISEVQGFSKWRAFANLIISVLVVIVPIILIIGFFVLIR